MVRLCNRALPTGLFETKLQWGVAARQQRWTHCPRMSPRQIDIHGAFSGILVTRLKPQIS
jgi:hypothetical protein